MMQALLWIITLLLSPLAMNTPIVAAAQNEIEYQSETIATAISTDAPELGAAVQRLTRSSTWNQTEVIPLKFETYHPQGLAITPTRIFLSSVDIIEATVLYPHPRKNGLDRSPGKGAGHLFVLNRGTGKLEKDIHLVDGQGDHKYHPGGIDYDGTYVYVPLAQYRPNSSASIYRVHAESLVVEKLFNTDDHYGGVVHNKKGGTSGSLVGNNWGSRNFTEWTMDGKVLRKWINRGWYIDYQDGQYLSSGEMIASGVANLPQTPSAQAALGASSIYELGGLALIDLKTTQTLWEVPLQLWSEVGHVITRNPFKLAIEGKKLTLWAAPDDGNEKGGTKLLKYVSDMQL